MGYIFFFVKLFWRPFDPVLNFFAIYFTPPSNKHSYDLYGKFDVFVPTLLRTAPKYQIFTIITRLAMASYKNSSRVLVMMLP